MIVNNDNLYAILGPTNTGKTYLAFERILSYKSGIFGFPLRLLARENYDKAIKKVGINKAALVTGEEKIIPKEAKYYFCTVESMPTNLNVECIAIDEVQLAADYERGHIFTDRILNLRGTFETIFLGSTTIKNILVKMFPFIKIEEKNRFSKLTYLHKQNISKLNPRSAIIAFNINKVYEIAETLRTLKGGAAVVLGSLSPRTRNAQVEVYEEKKVDYLVATDAIGMGLNLNINHIAFSSLEKFDGRYNRNLHSTEIAQIAGRAGRYNNNGTFGITREAGFLDPITINAVENHIFSPIQRIFWRNSSIDFTTVESVLSCLKKFPVKSYFIHKKNAEDEINFKALIEDPEIKSNLKSTDHIRLLWDVCRIPDFQKIFNDNYIMFLKTIFLLLVKTEFKIPEDWLVGKLEKLENFNGGIEELSSKISQIRTWTYIANNHNWLEKKFYWQEITHNIENKLSDKLHKGLTNRFIDASLNYFVSSENKKLEPLVEIDNNENVHLNKKNYGRIVGFELKLNKKKFSHSLFSLTHVKKSVRNMIEEKITNFLNAPNESINLGTFSDLNLEDKINIFWGEEPIGYILPGKNIFSPVAESLNSEFLTSEKKLLISAKLQNWLDEKITISLKPIKDKMDEEISPEVRAIAFNTFERLGILRIKDFSSFLKNINSADKNSLSKIGIRVGAKYFFMQNFLKKTSMELCGILWNVFNKNSVKGKYPFPENGRVSFVSNTDMPDSYWSAIGYLKIKDFCIRVDVFERIFFLARQKIKFGPFLESAELMNPVGCNNDQLKDLLSFCGFSNSKLENDKYLFLVMPKNNKSSLNKKNIISKKHKNSKNSKNKKINLKKNEADPNSPFAVLEKLL